MDSLFFANLSSPPLLFFFLGVIAALVRSDLQIPSQVAKLISIYLLMAIGFKGGVALSESTLGFDVARDLAAATLLATLIPLLVFFCVRRIFTNADAAALAATYGSISAVTFVTTTSYLDLAEVAWSGHMVAAMALMESPAIIVGLLLYRMHGSDSSNKLEWKSLCREAMLNGSVLLILGSLIVGLISGEQGMVKMHPFVSDLFFGMLCLFLLDMGIVAAQRIMDTRSNMSHLSKHLPIKMVLAATAMTACNAVIAVAFARALNMPEGDALLLVVLGASASYIAVPAAMRLALPQANPSIYLTMSLAITFPLNLSIGIPIYHQMVKLFVI